MSASDQALESNRMTKDDIFTRMEGIIQDLLALESVDTIQPETSFLEDLHMDSLAMVDIVIAIEEGFKIKMPSDLNIFEQVKTIGDAVDLVYDLTNS